MFESLSENQINILIASVLGDGELTKLYKNSRRKNSSYREHYGDNQKAYRQWKANLMDGLFYLTPKSNSLRSASSPLFTNLLNIFYNKLGQKTIPTSILKYCTNEYFLAVLYMDDGSLSISYRINHNRKKIYLTPHIYLYLQNYTAPELLILKNHIKNTFNIGFKFSGRKDGNGTILKTTSTKESFLFLSCIRDVSLSCPSMFYKTNWDYRLSLELKKWKHLYQDYEVLVSSPERNKNYSDDEIQKIISLKQKGFKDKDIAILLGRSYWSIIYKLSEIRKIQKGL